MAVFTGPLGASPMAVKTDSIGNILDTNILCGNGGYSIRNTNDSNFVLVTVADITCPGLMYADFRVYKLNENCDTLWMKTFGSPFHDIVNSIRPLKGGTFALTGFTFGDDNFYKLDSAGNVIWHHLVPMDNVVSVIEDSEGNFVLCGYTDFITNSWTVVKTDSTGANVLWAKYYGTTGGNLYDMFHDVVQLPDSNYLLGGWTDRKFMKVNKNTGDSIYADSSYGFVYSFDTASNGNFIAGGGAYLYLLNDTGGIIWIKGINNNTSIRWVRSTSDGGFIAAGYYYQGTQQWPMLLKTDSLGNFTTGINDLNMQVLNYNLYPNPLTTESRLEFGNAKRERYEFALYDITGREIETAFTNGDGFTIKKENKQAGLYLFTLRNENTGEVMGGKVVVE